MHYYIKNYGTHKSIFFTLISVLAILMSVFFTSVKFTKKEFNIIISTLKKKKFKWWEKFTKISKKFLWGYLGVISLSLEGGSCKLYNIYVIFSHLKVDTHACDRKMYALEFENPTHECENHTLILYFNSHSW
jgi:hypothetical protein